MKVEIWSDVMCPFCYIGKRKFEIALNQFSGKDKVEIEWRSFQLNPDMKTDPDKSINEYLSESKGWTLDYTRKANEHVTAIAKQVGLIYNFDKAVVANSFDAHRLSHLAKKYGLQNQTEEKLFSAYFTEGKNTADHETLVQIGTESGLNEEEVRTMLKGKDFEDAVRQDIYYAQQLGINAVPFFLFDDKYAVTGAQESATFLKVLNTVLEKSESSSVNPS